MLRHDSSQDPGATARVTQGQFEEQRRHLQLEQDRKALVASAASPPSQQTEPMRPAMEARPILYDEADQAAQEPMATEAPPRLRRVVKTLAWVAALSSLGVGVVVQTSHLPRFELPRFELPPVNLGPLLSAVGQAHTSLRAEYDKLFSDRLEDRPAPSLPLAPVPIVTQDRVPTVASSPEDAAIKH